MDELDPEQVEILYALAMRARNRPVRAAVKAALSDMAEDGSELSETAIAMLAMLTD